LKSQTYSQTAEDELMYWHQRLYHMPMTRCQKLGALGVLPTRIAKSKIPLCPACVFGKMTRKPWKHKGVSNPINKQHH
jgi:GAG-pre-integrase domain